MEYIKHTLPFLRISAPLLIMELRLFKQNNRMYSRYPQGLRHPVDVKSPAPTIVLNKYIIRKYFKKQIYL